VEAKIFDLGTIPRDAVITVHLDAMANVRLLTSVNFTAYLRRQYYKMHGGVALTPTFKISIPANAHWYLVLDVEGLESRTVHPRISVAR
jgi:hypothetical protein